MAHLISIKADGKAEAVYAGEAAWHGLGTVVDEAPDGATAIELAGLGWGVKLSRLFGGEPGALTEAPELRAIQRDDTGAVLGVCSHNLYTPWQNVEAISWLDSLLADGTLRYESLFAIKGGRQVAALARLEQGYEIAGEAYTRYLLVSWGHDGKTGISIAPTLTRVVCNNTLTAAIADAEATNRLYRISHLPRLDARLDEAHKAYTITTEATRALAEKLEAFAVLKLNKTQVTRIEEELFGKPSDRTTQAKAGAEQFASIVREEVQRNGLTAYSVLNGITGYADHGIRTVGKDEATRAERHFTSVFTGAAANFKASGIKVLSAVAGV